MNRPALLTLDDALAQLLAHATPLTHDTQRVQTVSTFEADGRVLAQAVVSELQVPPHDNSAMDGYAVRVADCQQADAVLRVTQRIPAGSHGTALNAGEAARIFTGAPIPEGADAVVMQEDCEALDNGERVSVRVTPARGAKCARCWKVKPEVAAHAGGVCARCDDVLAEAGAWGAAAASA